MINKLPFKTFYTILALLSVITFNSCQNTQNASEGKIYVTIAPIKYIVENIVDSDFDIEIMVPSNSSPETYEPTPKQYIAINESQAIMSTGLIDFENNLLSRLNDKNKLVNLSTGIETIEGSCSHNHHEEHHHHGEHEHHHGVDPHIWTSPKALQQMAGNCFAAINRLYPDSIKYKDNYNKLLNSLVELDKEVSKKIADSSTKSFIIYHPAYTYFARDYNIDQVAIEDEGKDPSTRRIGSIIDRAREEGVSQILYQNQFPSSVVDIIASDAKAKAVAVNPLSEDIVAHILEFTNIITTKQ